MRACLLALLLLGCDEATESVPTASDASSLDAGLDADDGSDDVAGPVDACAAPAPSGICLALAVRTGSDPHQILEYPFGCTPPPGDVCFLYSIDPTTPGPVAWCCIPGGS